VPFFKVTPEAIVVNRAGDELVALHRLAVDGVALALDQHKQPTSLG
jgi:hypothetical protein